MAARKKTEEISYYDEVMGEIEEVAEMLGLTPIFVKRLKKPQNLPHNPSQKSETSEKKNGSIHSLQDDLFSPMVAL